MACKDISKSKRRAVQHFYGRFKFRGITNLISIRELEDIIKRSYEMGKTVLDKKHSGLEGPRYRIFIKKGNKQIVVIIEKTKDCLLPITVWFESIR